MEELNLLYRIYGLNLIQVDKKRYFYFPFQQPRLYSTWFEMKREPKSLMDIATNFLIKGPVSDFKLIKELNFKRDEHNRKTYKGRGENPLWPKAN